MLILAIDGACRRNGKPDCVAAGGVFIQQYDEDLNVVKMQALTNYELKSTNQRGELLALLTALDHIWSAKQEAQIVTDSEYLFNAMTKDWCKSWSVKGWVTALNEPVKNQDLWKEIYHAYRRCVDAGLEISFYHIKGHCIPFGKVTATGLLNRDDTGAALYAEALLKYDAVSTTSRADVIKAANDLSERNNGFKLSEDKLKHFVVLNTMADAIATKCVEAADALMD